MEERRSVSFPRKKRRYLVEYSLEGSSCNGFSHDVSASGIFVRSARLPDPGTNLTLSVHLPGGSRLTVRCKVVRTHRVPGRLSTVKPSGFAVRIIDAPEDYYQLLATL
jgi:hypothetical protein